MNLYAALPIMNEPSVEKTLQQILAQTVPPKALYICVNQPESYKTDLEKRHIFEQNQKTIAEIHKIFPEIKIIDKSTTGWDSKNHGVGWARKTLMDTINDIANPEDIIISLDADTEYPPMYFESVKHIFDGSKVKGRGLKEKNVSEANNPSPFALRPLPNIVALANPYYHKLTGHEAEDRAILRYEIYMRCYLKNLVRIRSPYAFTALGSAMAVRVDAYRKMGGMVPKKSGEDFYFLQQLSKIGHVETKNSVFVYPSNRLSDRVFFGTGPALIKGVAGDWNSYPIYSPKLWDEIAKIYQNFETYFSQEDYQKLKSNSKTEAQLQKFCHEKFDALRILQYLKSQHAKNPQPDEISLKENLETFSVGANNYLSLPPPDFSFESANTELLDEIRNALL
ncbi:MAG: glycosyltransferase family 2 protein [Bacteroidales bacterium]|nr:glycosyltransferase family 2 protein [Bacteroidales bacterium]